MTCGVVAAVRNQCRRRRLLPESEKKYSQPKASRVPANTSLFQSDVKVYPCGGFSFGGGTTCLVSFSALVGDDVHRCDLN